MPTTRRPAGITPLPVPAGAAGALLVGGTFDPPHRAHVDLPRSVRDRLCGRGWWLVFVPAARNPLKPTGPTATDAQRVEMLALATARVPRCSIWTDELDRASTTKRTAEPSYWVDTLRRACAWLDGSGRRGLPLRFALGSDAAASLHQWRQPREILSLAEPIVMLRPPHRAASDLRRALRATGFWTSSELDAWSAAIDDAGAAMPHAATDARRALRTGDAASARAMLTRSVLAFIRERGLYGCEPKPGVRGLSGRDRASRGPASSRPTARR